jgi:phage-related minor tail protein
MADPFDTSPQDAVAGATELDTAVAGLTARTDALVISTNSFSSAMARAFVSASIAGRSFDDVLKGLALRISGLAVADAFKPLTAGLSNSLNSMFSGLFSGGSASVPTGFIPFASGGVIGAPSYFPMQGGRLGLAGEAGPEAIMPLTRGPDGRLGVATNGGGASTINVTISTPDAASFRRSEAYLTGQIARAVSRGQRSL